MIEIEKENNPRVPFPGLRNLLAQQLWDEENKHCCGPRKRFVPKGLPTFDPRNLLDMDKTPWPGE
ncbi:MAG: hypothetical protein WA064_02215 [Candidatus Moraniibacteriota bacterium]